MPLYFSASDAAFAAVVSTVVSTVLNPLSPFPGISFPFLGSWFLFTFSSVDLSVSFSVAKFFSFGILSNTKALFFNATVTLSTSPCVAVSLASRA